MREPFIIERQENKLTLHRINLFIIFLIALSFYGYFIRPPDWNVNSRLGLVKAIVEEKRLTIDSYHEGELETYDKAFFNGHYYSDKAIGTSLLGAVVYAPIYLITGRPLPTELFIMLTTVLAVSIPCALLAPLIYSISIRIVKEKWIALSIALLVSLGTPFFPYAGAFYGHSLAGVLAFSVFFLWMEVNQLDAQVTSGRILLSGFLIGCMVLTEYTTLLIAISLIGYMIGIIYVKRISWDWKTICLFLAGGMVPLILLMLYNWLCFGSPLTLGYSNEYLSGFREMHSEGLMGIGWPNFVTLIYMTVHPMMGMFVQSPVLLFFVGGLVVMLRERALRVDLLFLVSTILIYFLAVSGFKLWWGGDSFTVRHLIPILPFFGIFMIFLPRKYHFLFVVTGLISFFQMLAASATNYHPFHEVIVEILKKGFASSWKTSLLYQEVLPDLFHNRLGLTWGKVYFGLDSWYFNLAAPLFVAGLLLILFCLVNRRENKL